MTEGATVTTADRRVTRLFIDALAEDVARVLLGEQAFTLPTSVLPRGAREGDWVELSIDVIAAPPSDSEAIREDLAKDDPGGTIKL